MFDIETLANDIDVRIKVAIEREVLFYSAKLFFFCENIVRSKNTLRCVLFNIDKFNIKYPRLGHTGFFEISFYYYEYVVGR